MPDPPSAAVPPGLRAPQQLACPPRCGLTLAHAEPSLISATRLVPVDSSLLEEREPGGRASGRGGAPRSRAAV